MYFLLFVNHFWFLMLFHKMPTLCQLYSLQRFCSTSLYSFSTFVLNRLSFATESSVILCCFLSIVQFFRPAGENALDCSSGIFVHSLYVSRINDNHRAIVSDYGMSNTMIGVLEVLLASACTLYSFSSSLLFVCISTSVQV